ncbi:MAG: ATP-binding protein [Imperialibacter sp.]|uniref:ATP-binding protein n=1 Tax=Imperialibacter sp. TaxID=2038411 RepID=UPI003A85F8C9
MLRKAYILLLLAPLVWGTAFSQETPYPYTEDSLKATSFLLKAEIALSEKRLDSAIFYGNNALAMAESRAIRCLIARSNIVIGDSYKQKEQFASSLNHYLVALREFELLGKQMEASQSNDLIGELYDEWKVPQKAWVYFMKAYEEKKGISDTLGMKYSLGKAATAFELAGNNQKAIENYQLMLQLIKDDDKQAELTLLRRLALLHIDEKKHTLALAYDLQVLSIYQALKDTPGIIASLNNIGYLYQYLDEKMLALEYFKESLELDLKHHNNDPFYVGDMVLLANIGSIYHDMGDNSRALNYFFEAIKSNEARKTPSKTLPLYNEVVATYMKMDQWEKARTFAETAIQIGEKLPQKSEDLIVTYKRLSDIHEHLGDYKQSLSYFKKFAWLSDSISTDRQLHAKSQLNQLLTLDKKENEIRLLMVEKEIKDLALKELQLESQEKQRDIELLQRDNEIQRIILGKQLAEKIQEEQKLKLEQARLEAQNKDNDIELLQKNKFIQDLALKKKELEEKENQKEIEILLQEQAIQDLELTKIKSLRNFFIGVTSLVLVILFLILRSYRINARAKKLLQGQNEEINYQKEEIENQKDKLEESYNDIKRLSEVAKEINSHLSVSDIVQIVFRYIHGLMDYSIVGVGLFEEDSHKLKFQVISKGSASIEKINVSHKKADHPAIACLENSREEIFFDTTLQPDFVGFSTNHSVYRSVIYLPLVVKNKRIGVLTVQHLEAEQYQTYQVNILRSLALHVAIALENASAYQQIAEKTHNLEKALMELKAAQAKLIQAEKMASLGELTAGIAHEINNPVNFVYAGVDGLKNSLQDLITVLNKYAELEESDESNISPAFLQEITALKEQLYFNETKEGMFQVVEAIREGAVRTSQIVHGLRTFSMNDKGDKQLTNLQIGIDNSLVLLSPKIKEKRVRIKKEYGDSMRPVECFPGQINQVFMNLISNALDAVAEKGVVTIRTEGFADKVKIYVEDDGCGMSDDIQNKIFEPFFTTKGYGKGTGLGLSITFGIIERHGGSIEVVSTPGSGSRFTITLPV